MSCSDSSECRVLDPATPLCCEISLKSPAHILKHHLWNSFVNKSILVFIPHCGSIYSSIYSASRVPSRTASSAIADPPRRPCSIPDCLVVVDSSARPPHADASMGPPLRAQEIASRREATHICVPSRLRCKMGPLIVSSVGACVS